MFEPLTHDVLRRMREKGYNVLKSTSKWGAESPTYYPDFIEGDVFDYLMERELERKSNSEDHFLVIDEALTIPEEQLFGVVLTGLG